MLLNPAELMINDNNNKLVGRRLGKRERTLSRGQEFYDPFSRVLRDTIIINELITIFRCIMYT